MGLSSKHGIKNHGPEVLLKGKASSGRAQDLTSEMCVGGEGKPKKMKKKTT